VLILSKKEAAPIAPP